MKSNLLNSKGNRVNRRYHKYHISTDRILERIFFSIHFSLTECYMEKPWPINESIIGVEKPRKGTIILKSIENRENPN